ncbi:Trimethyllysine dioxygenase [Violaceomyces palustris]|uniref:Trimethyllysine dioxygenase n=1 Tax=Violaceomyces palustris TaxID=1673888 RepID=A0ACD0NX92_9BASI|nr:Trimethyllysine dioxygenase [Violaceomyces palustris]
MPPRNPWSPFTVPPLCRSPRFNCHPRTTARVPFSSTRPLVIQSLSSPARQRFGFSTFSALHVNTARPLAFEALSASSPTSAQEVQQNGPSSPGVLLDAKSKSIHVTWASGITSKFHNIWLRDHCRCAQCYHPKTKQRLINTFQIPADIQPTSVESTTEGLLVQWPPLPSEVAPSLPSDSSHAAISGDSVSAPDHASLYPWRWLMDNSYAPLLSGASKVIAANDSTSQASEKVLWGKGIGTSPPTVNYEEVMQSEEGVLKWLNKISQYGFSFVNGVPPTPTDTEALIRRISFIRETHYGGFWDFTSDLSHGDTAYTDLALQAHTDTTYFTDPAGLQMFHLLSHTASKSVASSGAASSKSNSAPSVGPSGGESLLVDGFLAAAVLKDVHPEAYETLSRVRIRTHSAGDDNTMIRPLMDGGYPILQHDDATGELVLIRYNNDDRSVLRIPEAEVEPFYDALRKWNEILTNEEGQYWTQLKPGTALIFDNHRVLHGRSSFVGNRRLCGAYIPHDDYRSRLTVLRTKFGDAKRSVRGVWDDGI